MPLRLGIITDEVSQDLDEALQLARQFSLSAVELRSVDDRLIHQFDTEELLDIKESIQEAGLEVCALSTPIFKCSLSNAQEVAEHRHILEEALAAADTLQAKILRAFTFWREGEFGEAFPRIVDEFRRIEPLVRQSGKILVVEPDPAVYASNASLLRQVLVAVDSPHIKALYDPGNHLWDPHGEEPYPFAYRHLKPFIAHVHLKDAVIKDGQPTAVAIGRGEVGYPQLLRELIMDEFPGYLVVETHYRLNRQLDEDQLKRPQGSAFSSGGWAASVETLTCLTELLAEIDSA